MKNTTKQQIITTTKRAAIYWLKAQVASGKTENEIVELFKTEDVKSEIKESAKRLM